jgi:hypothetical protein
LPTARTAAVALRLVNRIDAMTELDPELQARLDELERELEVGAVV